jgi:hypothetical protein
MSIQTLATTNLMVPAEGGVDVLSIAVPGDLNGNYTVDFPSLSQQQGGPQFTPQAVTVDLSQIASGQSVTFNIPALGYNRVLQAGTTATFQFPALQNLQVVFIPSQGGLSFPTFWYNYPALPDGGGGGVTLVTDAGVLTQLQNIYTALQQPPGDTGTDYSANAPATFADLLLTIPTNATRKGFFIQNQDGANQVMVVIDDGAGNNLTKILLNAAGATPGQGGSVDFSGIPTQGRIRVYGTVATSPVAAHDF